MWRRLAKGNSGGNAEGPAGPVLVHRGRRALRLLLGVLAVGRASGALCYLRLGDSEETHASAT